MPIAKSQVRGKIDPLRAEGSRLKQSVGSPSSDVETRPQLRWLDISVPPAPKLRAGGGVPPIASMLNFWTCPKVKPGRLSVINVTVDLAFAMFWGPFGIRLDYLRTCNLSEAGNIPSSPYNIPSRGFRF